MKKLILILVVVLSSFVSKAQDVMDTYAVEIGYWQEKDQDWYFDDFKMCEVSFIIQGKMIIANDMNKSTYYLYNMLLDEKDMTSWNAIDEKDRECVISMALKDDYRYFIVIYDDICYRYYW
jgi:hypothetical protein